jgi:hypothetical protein
MRVNDELVVPANGWDADLNDLLRILRVSSGPRPNSARQVLRYAQTHQTGAHNEKRNETNQNGFEASNSGTDTKIAELSRHGFPFSFQMVRYYSVAMPALRLTGRLPWKPRVIDPPRLRT